MSAETGLIAARYASALFELATEQKQQDQVKADLTQFRAVLAEGDRLTRLLTNPLMTRAEAEKAIAIVMEAMKAGELTRKFFVLLARERRLAVAPQAAEKFLALLAESRGELDVKVTSAEKLSGAQVKELEGSLSASTGKKVSVQASENPALLGGLQIRIGSKMLDHSVAGKLARMRLALTRAA